MAAFKDRTGERFGRLLVIGRSKREGKRPIWECLCDCGNIVFSTSGPLTSGSKKSCGCLHRDSSSERTKKRNTSHGMSHTKEYWVWQKMIDRCRRPKSKDFKDYGARGIKVCDRWLDFQNFIDDMGKRPSDKHSIDRMDVNKGYEPSNCRWSTHDEQANNRRGNLLINFDGQEMTVANVAKLTGERPSTLYGRVSRTGTVKKKGSY